MGSVDMSVDMAFMPSAYDDERQHEEDHPVSCRAVVKQARERVACEGMCMGQQQEHVCSSGRGLGGPTSQGWTLVPLGVVAICAQLQA